jgi:hypothetical protein
MTRRHQAHRVYTRANWADEWTLRTGVYCESFSFASGPDVAEAVLSYHYGKLNRAGALEKTIGDPLDLNGLYVKVELDQITDDQPEAEPLAWYGVVVETADDRRGLMTHGAVSDLTGRQVFQCRGMEFFLQRTTLAKSWVRSAAGEEYEIGRAIGFNLGGGRDSDHKRLGNMRLNAEGDFVFDSAIGEQSEEWNAAYILQYLISRYSPKDAAGQPSLPFSRGSDATANILLALKPTLQAHGKNLKQLIDEIVDRRRLVGYTIVVTADVPTIEAFTFNASGMTLPGGEFIPANSNQTVWLTDEDRTIRVLSLVEDDATRFDRVIAQGELATVTTTLRQDQDTWEKDWDDETETEYKTAATGSSGYGALDVYQKENRNQAYRRRDKFKKVYRYFRIPTTATSATFPEDDIGTQRVWWAGLRLIDRLPLLTDRVYTTVDSANSTDRTIDNSQPEYLRPFAVASLDAGVWVGLDSMHIGDQINESHTKTLGRTWSVSVRMQDDVPGVILDVQGAEQHVIAYPDFVPVEPEDDRPNQDPPEIDWRDIRVTVCAELDNYAEGIWPEGPLDTTADVVRDLYIHVPRCRLDYLAPQTVVGVNDAGALEETDGGFVRDDRELLKDVARSAYEWYGQTRRAMTVVIHDLVARVKRAEPDPPTGALYTDLRIGVLITRLGAEPTDVNSVVTKLAFDLRQGTITVTTQYAEFDPRAVVA